MIIGRTGRQTLVGASLVGVLCAGSTLDGAVVVDPGVIEVVQGTTRTVSIPYSGAAPVDVAGLIFTVQIDDGAGSTPSITAISLIDQTVWQYQDPTELPPLSPADPQLSTLSLISNPFALPTSGWLARVTFSAIGAPLGDHTLRFVNTNDLGNDSALLDNLGNEIPGVSFNNALLRIVAIPEMSTAMAFLSVIGWVTLRTGRTRETVGL
jgi:hypothetical protein